MVIRFADGTIEECLGEETKLPEEISLSEHFNSLELTQQYNYETSKKSSLVPMQIGEFWMCSCGKINANSEKECANCGCDKETVFNALDEDFLAERYSAYIENKRIEEEKLKQERERKRLIEQQRQEELERQRVAEIQNERNLAILKRVAVQEAADKRKKIIKIVIISVVVALIAIGIISAAIDSAHNSELRNFATETMKDEYNNVYADVVSIEPEYFVYTSSGTTYREITEVVCKCKTVEGKTIWVVFFSWKYPGGSAKNEDAYETLTYSKSNPARVTGYVTTSGSVIKQLESSIGNVFVLRVESMQK